MKNKNSDLSPISTFKNETLIIILKPSPTHYIQKLGLAGILIME